MPDDAIECVAEHSSRLQPLINVHASVTAFMFSCSGTDRTDVLPRMKARVSHVLWSSPIAPTQDLNRGGWIHSEN